MEAAKDKDLIRFLLSYFKEQRLLIVLSLVGALGTAGVNVAIAQLVRAFTDKALADKDWNLVLIYCGILVGIFFVAAVMHFLHRFSLRVAVDRVIRKLRDEVFSKLLIFSHAQSQRYTAGQSVTRLIADTQVLNYSNHLLADVIREPIVIVGVLGYLFYLNWQLTLFCLVAIPVIALIGKAFSRSARRNQGRLQGSLDNISNHIVESVGGLRTAHALGQTHTLESEFQEKNHKTYSFLLRLARVEELVGPLTKWATSWIAAALVAFGGYLVVNDRLTLGTLLAFLTAAGALQQPLRQINQIAIRLQQILAAAQRIFGLLNEPLDQLAIDQQKLLRSWSPVKKAPTSLSALKLEWRNLSFRYSERLAGLEESGPAAHQAHLSSAQTLDSINLSLEVGQKLALVGRSGSGKSTLSLLALRFLDPDSGAVLLGERDSRQWPLNEYRAHFSYVSQDVYLFNRSLRENLILAAPAATEKELWHALERAQIDSLICRLPQGLDTPLGEHAGSFSGGEKQRIAIARAFLRNAPLLVLDEATSQLDSFSESALQESLKELCVERSVLVIAHRLSTVEDADRIAVLDQGKLIEEGAPGDLLSKKQGHFWQLWNEQHGKRKDYSQTATEISEG